MRTIHACAAAGAAALLLTACGGGGGGGAPAPDPGPPPTVEGSQVPVAATQSAAAAVRFGADVAALGENETPLVLGDATLATSETDEPQPL